MIVADARRLPYGTQTAHMACCSPPYYQKRRYAGVESVAWPEVSYSPMPGLPPVDIPAVTADCDPPEAGLLGLEPDPFAYIGHLILVAREVWRVMRDDGVFCVNIGDTYASGGRGGNQQTRSRQFHGVVASGTDHCEPIKPALSYKPKDLMGIPWRLAFALLADGWILRSRMPGGVEMRPDVIWTKNAMPESVRDRPSVDFEDVFIFSKTKRYFWDQENGRAPGVTDDRPRSTWEERRISEPDRRGDPAESNHVTQTATLASRTGANMRASWKINTEPTNEDHYAAWPRELVRRLIRIGTSDQGCCSTCGAQWVRRVKKQRLLDGMPTEIGSWKVDEGTNGAQGVGHWRFGTSTQDLGFAPGCSCCGEPAPCRVLDPFSGIGRTGEVCYETGRIYMPAELSIGYATIQEQRLREHRAVKRGEALVQKQMSKIEGPLFSEAS